MATYKTLQDLDSQPNQRLSGNTLVVLAEHPEWIPPRSDVRIFLGEPGAPEAVKTTVEPGNIFSPGMRTFGVTWWLRFPDTGDFYATEEASLESLQWSYEEGYLPLTHCQTSVNSLNIRHSLFQDGTATEYTEAVCGRLHLHNTATHETRVQVFLALRSLGPAGGRVEDIRVGPDGRSFWLKARNLPLLGVNRQPDAIGCGIGDPSPMARKGNVPGAQEALDPDDGWGFGIMRFDVVLASQASWQMLFDCPLQTYGTLENDIANPVGLRADAFETRAQAHLDGWRTRFGSVALDVPDTDFRNAFFAGLQHMLTAIQGDQARIAPLSYPLPWLRDSIYIIRSFDLAGLHDLARAATAYCARNDFFGGFGAEGDAPGQGIWALVQHYRITGDKAWLATVYPAVRRKVEWIYRMRRAERPIQIFIDTPVVPYTFSERASGVICVRAQHGIIMGSMDHGIDYSVGWVNHWALCGLSEAAFAAQELGYVADVDAYRYEFDTLKTCLRKFISTHPDFFNLERTVNSLIWPTRVWEYDLDQIEVGFNAWWNQYRGTEDAYQPEPYWLYFEFAQAHNALFFGQRERVWQVIQYRLSNQDTPGLYGWREGGDGIGTRNAVFGATIINQLRGCQRFDSIHPHGWSQSEMWLLQRALLVEEWQDALLLFAGIPAHWLKPDARIAFEQFPTWYGVVSAELQVNADGRSASIHISGVNSGVDVLVRLPNQELRATSTGAELSLTYSLQAY